MDSLFWFALIGLAAGLLASAFLRSGRSGAIADIASGIFGGLLGGGTYIYYFPNPRGLWGAPIAAALGAVLIILDLWLIRNILVQRKTLMRIPPRCAPVAANGLTLPLKQADASQPCKICGQKHLA